MRQHGRRVVLLATLILTVGIALAGSPMAALGQDATGTPEGTLDAGAIDLTTTPVGELSEGDLSVWTDPFNLSNSGAAYTPVIAAEPDGTLTAVWWDDFDGSKVSYYTPEEGWSEPQTAAQIIGGRTVVQGRTVRTAPIGLRLLGSSSGWVHAFWLDSKNNLRHARSRSQSGTFALGPTLAVNPLTWDVSIDADNNLHLAYIRADNTTQQPAGVYYRISDNDGAAFRSQVRLVSSLYFRSMQPGQAFVRAVGDGQGQVMVAWDDAELQQSYYTWSTDNGESFEEPLRVGQIDQDTARRTRLYPVGAGGGQFLRVWESGDACALYQQMTDFGLPQPVVEGEPTPTLAPTATATATVTPSPTPEATPDPFATPEPTLPPEPADLAWSDPVRVFDSFTGCLGADASYLLADGRLLSVLSVTNTRPLLVTWDGARWTDPLGLQISFVEPTANRPVTLNCTNTALAGDILAVVGCDQFGDVWVTTSRLGVSDLLPALTTAWSAPVLLTLSSTGEDSLPAAAVDPDGQVFAMWSHASAIGEAGDSLIHSNSDGVNWPGPVRVLEAADGKAEMPALAWGQGGLLHLVWSGGFTGQVLYSQAFTRDARIPSGWAGARDLPAPRPVGGWPDIAVDGRGVVHVVYTVPLNEDRGVYYTRSEDQGATWSLPRLVFDAGAAQWAMVRNTRLTVDEAGQLHLVWVRSALPGAGTSLGVYYSRSADGGQTWTDPLEMDGVEADNPRVVLAGPGEIHVAWTRPTTSGTEVIHQWSPDGGQSWSGAAPLLGLRRVVGPDFSLVSDGAGIVYLVGIESSRQNSAALFFVRWNGQEWVDRESVALGYDPAPGSGAAAVFVPGGTLGVFYRVRAPLEGGGARYIVGYVSRPVSAGGALPVATFTPRPPATQAGNQSGATRTPLPTPDLTNVTAPTVDNTVRTQIGVALVVILLISGLAVYRLWRGRR